MFRSTSHSFRRAAAVCLAGLAAGLLGGCAVVNVVGTTASIAATGAGLVVDAAAGTARIAGKAIGAAADAVLPGDEAR